MRIAWASPLNATSAIGRVSADVTTELVSRGRSVTFIATDLELGETHPTRATVRSWREVTPQALAEAHDVLIVNIGDHYGFHGGLFPLLGRLPTVGVFHDFYLYDLFNGWLAAQGLSDAERGALHDAEVVRIYGRDALAQAQGARSGQLALEDIAAALPMTEWLARRCQGAMAHASFYGERLKAACPGPVAQAWMPVSGRGVAPLEPRPSGKVTLVTVGVMNPNKCVQEVIAAICASERLKAQVSYRLAGPIAPAEAERLSQLASAGGYHDLTILGPVSDEDLKSHLQAADIISCLRRPILEGASGSAIEALLAGRPTLVADAGFYAELPDTIVRKTPAAFTPQDIAEQLERLVASPEERLALGAAARAWATERFSLEAYVQAVERLAVQTLQSAPILAVGDRIGADAARLGLSPEDPAVSRLAQVLGELFAPSDAHSPA